MKNMFIFYISYVMKYRSTPGCRSEEIQKFYLFYIINLVELCILNENWPICS